MFISDFGRGSRIVTDRLIVSQVKEYSASHTLRKIIALQGELTKEAPSVTKNLTSGVDKLVGSTGRGPAEQLAPQRTLLSANFGNTLKGSAQAANLLGRSVMTAGDRLRDMIIPDALVAIVSNPTWIPGMGGGGKKGRVDRDLGQEGEKLRMELEDVLASSCPLCEGVVAGLDKAFVKEGEVDGSWAL